MGKAQRRKGNNGELELAHILARHGIFLLRVPNSGGLVEKGDLKQDPRKRSIIDLISRWTIEVKRQETYKLGEWTAQADAQAEQEKKRPLLIFRKNHQPWRVVMHLDDYLKLEKEAEIGRSRDPN